MPGHEVHHFDRLVSQSDTGMAVFGCTFSGCGETEVRGRRERSPYAIKHEARRQRKPSRQQSRRGA